MLRVSQERYSLLLIRFFSRDFALCRTKYADENKITPSATTLEPLEKFARHRALQIFNNIVHTAGKKKDDFCSLSASSTSKRAAEIAFLREEGGAAKP